MKEEIERIRKRRKLRIWEAPRDVPHMELTALYEIPGISSYVAVIDERGVPQSQDVARFCFSTGSVRLAPSWFPVQAGDHYLNGENIMAWRGGTAEFVLSGAWSAGDFHHGATSEVPTCVWVAHWDEQGEIIPSDVVFGWNMLMDHDNERGHDSHGCLLAFFTYIIPGYTSAQQQLIEVRQMIADLSLRVAKLES
jgi:hypothetical protein